MGVRMKIKVYFEGDNQNLTIEINEHIIRNIPIQTAIERYSDYEEVIS